MILNVEFWVDNCTLLGRIIKQDESLRCTEGSYGKSKNFGIYNGIGIISISSPEIDLEHWHYNNPVLFIRGNRLDEDRAVMCYRFENNEKALDYCFRYTKAVELFNENYLKNQKDNLLKLKEKILGGENHG